LPVLSIQPSNDMTIIPQTDCIPENGSATVNFVKEDGTQFASGGYTFEFFDVNMNSIQGPSASNTISNQAAGDYFVQATNSTSSCQTSMVSITIADATSLPQVEAIAVSPTTNCDTADPNGRIEVTADGTVAGYSFEWLNTPNLEMSNIATDLDSGAYQVRVTNISTGCVTTSEFIVDVAIEFPQVIASSQNIKSCIAPDGRLVAQISNLAGSYDFNWERLDESSNSYQPYATGDILTGVPEGIYRVQATDPTAPLCASEYVYDTISIATEVPNLEIIVNNPQQFCDPDNPNGSTAISAYFVDEEDGDSIEVTQDYTIEWYKSSDPSTSVNTGRKFTNAEAVQYNITLTHFSTGCIENATIEIPEELIQVQTPDITITQEMISCLSPNGAANASINDETEQYTFNWYLGEVDSTAEFTGSAITTLDVATYSVTATDTLSKCVSEPVVIEFPDGREVPKLTFDIKNELCETENGTVSIDIDSKFEIVSVEWETPQGVINAPMISNYPAGDYSVMLTDVNGCSYTETFSIEADINVFNGLSPNGDGVNDEWEIGCIDDFLNNNVKIFNRSGALVYEVDQYNNSEIIFRGEGNRGIYIGNQELPDGTYFYVIDKGNGDQQLTGFIELFR
ncbi:gliding motility-associated C-terminal domain-containing protein, partial [Fulvivirga sp. RKSG066]|uniref:gliding motility-associated C-terminal domain-containing protein n=1 Tax=Fulvivirga aurantia TaxID=2529383 RepID=UPI0012BCBC48